MGIASDGAVCANCGQIWYVHCPTETNGLLPKVHEVDGRIVALKCPGFEEARTEPDRRARAAGERRE